MKRRQNILKGQNVFIFMSKQDSGKQVSGKCVENNFLLMVLKKKNINKTSRLQNKLCDQKIKF